MSDNSYSVDSISPHNPSNLERYRSIDILSLNDACALIADCDPNVVEIAEELEGFTLIPLLNHFFISKNKVANSTASEVFSDNLKLLKNAIRHNTINAQVVYIRVNHLISEDEIDSERTTVSIKDLKKWLQNRNIYPSFFFPEGDINDFMNSKNQHYAPKLALCVAAWQAAQNSIIEGQTIKQYLAKWMKENASKFGVENGGNNFFEELASTSNWDNKGGKPSKNITSTLITDVKK